ncbi:hypothetical protein VNO77_37179 [Canavalia gladiata]|uniref:Receptor-like serine/threonine-protein kinase n=1 Tax=Canavalia gladiata TaxID=3824 RepID=A0AAN9KBU7_CANGL
MANLTFIIVILAYIIVVPYARVSKAADSITVSGSITDGTTLVSQKGTFELGFFSPGKSNKRYLGIWYKKVPDHTVVWVANGDNPINGSSGMLKVNSTGNLVLTQNDTVFWNTTSRKQAKNPVVVLLDNGNLVVRNEGDANQEDYLWQSFDFPSNTQLPDMKLGRSLQLGIDWRVRSWKSPDDPSPGEFSWGIELYNYPEYYLMNGNEKFFRIGPWNGLYFSGLPEQTANSIYGFEYVNNKDEIYFINTLKNDSVISITVLNQSSFSRFVWVEGDKTWRTFKSLPNGFCDTYGLCGAYGNCMSTETQVCQCLKGFTPKSPQAWNSSNWSQGCVRNIPLSCKDKDKDGFAKFQSLKVPDTTYTWMNQTMSLEECRVMCLNNCSCMAYTNSDIRGTGSGCVMWFGDLIDIKQYQSRGQDLYIRMSALELEPRHKKNMLRTIVAATVSSICGVLLLSSYFVYRVRRNTAERSEEQVEDLDLPLFNLQEIATATKDFSLANKIGEGGFGPVYRPRPVYFCGYMAPEYAVDGLFSVKSDVFSFGILILEIICGKRNKAYYHTDNTLNLVGLAWTMWKEDRALELIDSNMGDSYIVSEVLRCMHVGLLCVQQHPDDRPTMDFVILMLGSEIELAEPKEPGFISRDISTERGLHTNPKDQSSTSEITISLLKPRTDVHEIDGMYSCVELYPNNMAKVEKIQVSLLVTIQLVEQHMEQGYPAMHTPWFIAFFFPVIPCVLLSNLH